MPLNIVHAPLSAPRHEAATKGSRSTMNMPRCVTARRSGFCRDLDQQCGRRFGSNHLQCQRCYTAILGLVRRVCGRQRCFPPKM